MRLNIVRDSKLNKLSFESAFGVYSFTDKETAEAVGILLGVANTQLKRSMRGGQAALNTYDNFGIPVVLWEK